MNKLKLTIARWKFYYKRNIRIHLIYFLIMADIMICGYSYMQWQNEWKYQSQLHGDAYTTKAVLISPVSAATSSDIFTVSPMQKSDTRIATEKEIKDYVKNKVEKAGLDWNEVNCIVKNESGWDQFAQGVNNNKSTDSGLWQINSIHKNTISLMDRFDYKKSTKWSIEKRLHDGNWDSWYGAKNCR